LLKAIFTVAADSFETVTVTSFEVAFAVATVAASITLNLAVPGNFPVIEHRINPVAGL